MVTEARETGSLTGSDKVEGTAVYGVNDTKIGSIERVIIDKMSGKVSYAVLSFGGFLGIGDDHYPLPNTIPTLAVIAPALPKVSSRERRNIATTTPGTGTTPQGLAR